MYCFQCQETAKNQACVLQGICGKSSTIAALQDVLVFSAKGLAWAAIHEGKRSSAIAQQVIASLFVTITNANFDEAAIRRYIEENMRLKKQLLGSSSTTGVLEAVRWDGGDFLACAAKISLDQHPNIDIRSLTELLIYGLKGIAAYAHHAFVLKREDADLNNFILESLAYTLDPHTVEELTQRVLSAGAYAVRAMSLLDAANTDTYGHPQMGEVKLSVGQRPGILISGHDLKDLELLLEQTKDSGVDVYTHCEMLPANFYPFFKKYKNLVGHYGNAWWQQNKDFESFNGPILMTTNCIIPLKDSYAKRIFTTGCTGYPNVPHIEDSPNGKDFSKLIALAKTCKPPVEIERGTMPGGFAHHQLEALAETVIKAIQSGAIKRFIVMAGCDGRHPSRQYYTDVAKKLPANTVILTAGCAKFRYNKLGLGTIGGIPRVLDAGQCNDSYSLALIALKLKEIVGAANVNDLPISFDIAWYEQKAVAVLLALLHLGFKGIRLGPTLPAFLSPNVAKLLIDTFALKPIGTPEADIADMLG
ncbi:MAG: hydroxylamine reductase [Verrucomicrobia bacterium GWF2_51_19]|nr:MAG: hydroxylamine reductase [Verrucomicrobia bacterium GWF2_51_19]HCJ11576.1 hydroxylamine reductase [Opitutae bacterium]